MIPRAQNPSCKYSWQHNLLAGKKSKLQLAVDARIRARVRYYFCFDVPTSNCNLLYFTHQIKTKISPFPENSRTRFLCYKLRLCCQLTSFVKSINYFKLDAYFFQIASVKENRMTQFNGAIYCATLLPTQKTTIRAINFGDMHAVLLS